MPSDLHIRAVVQADLATLLALYDQLHPNAPKLSVGDAQRILARFQHYEGSAIFAGFVGAALVTSCTLVVIPNLTQGGTPYALIENVVTDVGYRKRGYGQAILQAAVATAWAAGCYKVMLLTGAGDPATLRFYEGCGFERSKTGFQMRRVPARETLT